MIQGVSGPAGRLALALGASALLHAWLLGGVSVHRPLSEWASSGELQATLESGVEVNDAVTPETSSHRPSVPRPLPMSEPVAGQVDASHSAGQPAPLESVTPPSQADALPASIHVAVSADVPEPKPALEMPSITDTTVYRPHELDVFPLPVAPIIPVYPYAADAARIAGQATVELVIDEEGAVRETHLVDASPAGYFESVALESVRGVRFRPAQREGRAVRARIAIRLDFRPAGERSGAVQ